MTCVTVDGHFNRFCYLFTFLFNVTNVVSKENDGDDDDDDDLPGGRACIVPTRVMDAIGSLKVLKCWEWTTSHAAGSTMTAWMPGV